jgi:hypothetical protein
MQDFLDHEADRREEEERSFIEEMLDMELPCPGRFRGPVNLFPARVYVEYRSQPIPLSPGEIVDRVEYDGVAWVRTALGIYEAGEVAGLTPLYYPVMGVTWREVRAVFPATKDGTIHHDVA